MNHIGQYLSMTALHVLMNEPRFAKFTRDPVVVSVEIREPEKDEGIDAYLDDIVKPAMRELIASLPLDLVQFVEPPKGDLRAVEAEWGYHHQGLSAQYRKHFNVVKRAMVSTLSVAYIPAS